MKVLFVYRVYGEASINPVVQNQLESLQIHGIEVRSFHIKEGGISSYLHAIYSMRKLLMKSDIDIIHAHYSFSGFIAVLSFTKPVVCSLMGSDVLNSNKLFLTAIKIFSKWIWKSTIVKSNQMKSIVPHSIIIPNGVDYSSFYEIDKIIAAKYCNFNTFKKNIIFVTTDLNSNVKNYSLAKSAISLLGENYILHGLTNVSKLELPYYYSAADLLLLTSKSEGSPNVIKEALACNCPIVSTDVGDIRENLKNVQNCMIVDGNPEAVAKAIERICSINLRSNGREMIEHLSAEKITKDLSTIYKNLAP